MSGTKRWGVLLTVLMILVASSVWAQPRGRSGRPQGMSGGPNQGVGVRCMETLKLSDAQQSKVDELHLKTRQQMVRLRGQLAAARAELKALMMDGDVDRSAVNAAGDALDQLQSQMRKLRIGTQLDMREILTEDQFKELQKCRAGRSHHRRGGRGGRGFGGGEFGGRGFGGDRGPAWGQNSRFGDGGEMGPGFDSEEASELNEI